MAGDRVTLAPGPGAIVDLDDPRAADAGVAGAKAAGLARAREAGLPVLDGFVIAAAASAGALDAGRERLAAAGTGGARLAVIRSELDGALRAAIARAAGRLPEPLIVRSSSVLEGRGEWSGAFTSVPEVRRDEIPKAARSVWATCFAPDVLERCDAAGLEPGRVPIAVLVQSEIGPDFGGAASVDANGAVTVDAVKGSPRDLMAGWVPGVRAVDEDGTLVGRDALDLMGEERLSLVVALARRVHDELGDNLVEWAVHDGRVVLLQVQRSVRAAAPEPAAIPAALGHPFARELAVMTQRYPGRLGEELVLGWLPGSLGAVEAPARPDAGATGETARLLAVPGAAGSVGAAWRPDAGATGETARLLAVPGAAGSVGAAWRPDAGATLADARRLAAELTSQAWGEPADRALAHARLVLRRLRSDRPNEAIEALRDLRPVDPGAAARVLAQYAHLAGGVGEAGGAGGAGASGRRGRDRWEPLLAGVAALQGEAYDGRGSVGGIGAGRLVWVDGPAHVDHVRPRDIVVAQYPLANFSPLLWDAAGIVTVGGATSAHLFEVARSLTVPAVVDCPIGAAVRDGPVLGMVDGDTGRVAVLR